MHTILVMAPISSCIIDLWDRCMNDGKRVMVLLSHVAHHMLFIMLQLMVHWLDDAILYPVSFWCVSLQIKSYIFLWRDCNNFSLHGVTMFWPLVPFTFVLWMMQKAVALVSVCRQWYRSYEMYRCLHDCRWPICCMSVEGKTRECGAHLSSVSSAFHNTGV